MQEIIKVEQLSKSYGNLLAVDNISLSVKRGTVYGLLGANGAGKSTTIECILGTRKADSGTVSVLGYNPRKNAAAFSRMLVFSFKRVTISRKSRFPNYAKKRLVFTNPPQTGKNFVAALG